jgi:hypothetical protein
MTGSRRSRRGQRKIELGVGRETDLKRRSGQYEQRSTVLIATNGKCTERQYFLGLKQEDWVRVGRISVVFESGSPLEVVRGAAGRRDRNDYDEAWAVCDVDQYSVVEASTEAGDLNVSLLWSNPSFEVWLILHKSDCFAYIDGAAKAGDLLRALVVNWDKTKLDFSSFRDGVDDAVRRAKALGDPPAANPSTGVWRLVEALRDSDSGSSS